MKIIQYCQHVLGIGHLFRSLEICRALSDHEVILVTGGPRVTADLPENVCEVRLPDLQMNQEFKGLFSSRENASLDQIKRMGLGAFKRKLKGKFNESAINSIYNTSQ